MEPLQFVASSVWRGQGADYFIDGKKARIKISDLKDYSEERIAEIRQLLLEYREQNEEASSSSFQYYIDRFVQVNRERYDQTFYEASQFILQVSENFTTKNMFISFSGGKDSTVTADLVARVLMNPSILHIYGDTTLEFGETEIGRAHV